MHLLQPKQEKDSRTSKLSNVNVARFAKVASLSDSVTELPPEAGVREDSVIVDVMNDSECRL